MKEMLLFTAMLGMASSSCAVRAHTRTPARDLNLITHEQLTARQFRSAYEAVLSLHSNWLLARNSSVMQNRVQVYLDNVRLGGIEELHAINIGMVSYIRHHDGIDATARWGIDHGAGVIYVSTHPVPALPRTAVRY